MSAVAVVGALEARDTTRRGLRIEFFRAADRYAHRILAVGCEELPVILLESVEGTADDPWPPSPAFQALNFEELQDGNPLTQSRSVAMLVGMSGTTHWSMTVNPSSNLASDESLTRQPGFYFDAAGRLKSSPTVLSTRYSVGKRVRVSQSGNEMMLQFGSGQAQLDLRLPDGSTDAPGWKLATRNFELQFELTPDLSRLHLPATLRWSYSLMLCVD